MDANTLKTMFSSDKNFWETPKKFYDKLNKIYSFTLDPCASHNNHKCVKYFTEEENGLKQDWSGNVVFVNPPYDQNKLWIQKCYEEGKKPNTKVVLLIPSRTDTKYWHEYCMKAQQIFFIKGRLFFEIDGKPILDKKGRPMPAPFPSAVIEFNSEKNIVIPNIGVLEAK